VVFSQAQYLQRGRAKGLPPKKLVPSRAAGLAFSWAHKRFSSKKQADCLATSARLGATVEVETPPL